MPLAVGLYASCCAKGFLVWHTTSQHGAAVRVSPTDARKGELGSECVAKVHGR